MNDRIYYINLYDYYGELLTEKQRNSFEDYYFNNLTLAEISENEGVSRNAIHKQVKEVERNLTHYEEILKLYENGNKIKELIRELDQDLQNKIKELI